MNGPKLYTGLITDRSNDGFSFSMKSHAARSASALDAAYTVDGDEFFPSFSTIFADVVFQ